MFSARGPSVQWEPLTFPRCPGVVLWAWFRPEQLPQGVLVAVPAELSGQFPSTLPVTLAEILSSAGIPWPQFQGASLYGTDWMPAVAFQTCFHAVVPSPPAQSDPTITISVLEQPLMMPVMLPGPAPTGWMSGQAMSPLLQAGQNMGGPISEFPADGSRNGSYSLEEFPDDDLDFPEFEGELTESVMYQRIDAVWKSAVQIERTMAGLRQRLHSMQAGLGKLDRDLTPEERLASDREDRDEWNDARRWVRELQTKCHREIKAFDIGMTSAAGVRRHLDESYTRYIEPRVAFPDLDRLRLEFEKYRKDMVSLQRAMVGALQAATQNGTQRAQRILGSIAGKIRQMRVRNREPIGGTNLDRTCRRKS